MSLVRGPAMWRVRSGPGEWLESYELVRLVTGVARRRRVLPHEVPDLLQEVRIALWKLGPDARVNGTWVIRTAAHKGMDLLTTNLRLRAREQAFARRNRPFSGDPHLVRLLQARVDHLPIELRRFFNLRYRKGLSQREIALELGICRVSVRWLDHRCREMIIGRTPPKA